MTYTVYSIYYTDSTHEEAKRRGFVGSTQQDKDKVWRWHSTRMNNGTHTNPQLARKRADFCCLRVIAEGLTLDECDALLHQLRPEHGVGWNSTRAGRDATHRHTGKARDYQTRAAISNQMSKPRQPHSPSTRLAIGAAARQQYKPVDILTYDADKLVAQGVCLSDWCARVGKSKGNLYPTLRADRTQPHHWEYNRHHSGGYYARYSR